MDFSKLNEADIREEIIAPLIRELGYRSSTEHNVLREQILSYPKSWLGRKDVRKDALLRGKADYILEAGGLVRWVIEAKSPATGIVQDDIEQAWTYANHPEVRAVYFVLCNGRNFEIFQTSRGPNVPPIASFEYAQLVEERSKIIIANLLSPNAILGNHPTAVIDLKPPLAPGLRSIARITGGQINYLRSTLNLPALLELQISIIGGSVERNEEGKLVVYVESRSPTQSIQNFIERLGLTTFELTSEANEFSVHSESPSYFEYSRSIIFPAGEELMDINTWTYVTIQDNIDVNLTVMAYGSYKENALRGTIRNHMMFDNSISAVVEGEFCLYLA